MFSYRRREADLLVRSNGSHCSWPISKISTCLFAIGRTFDQPVVTLFGGRGERGWINSRKVVACSADAASNRRYRFKIESLNGPLTFANRRQECNPDKSAISFCTSCGK